jgi:YggT family protein
MTGNELRNQELSRHEEKVDRNIEHHQAVNLHEKVQGIETANQNSAVARIINIVYYLFGALEVLLLVRVILQLLGANADNGFANFIYGLSATFVSLFANLVQNPAVGTAGVLEVTTIIAIIAYMIAAWLIGQLIWLVLSRQR